MEQASKYTRESGKHYLDQRKASRSDYVQSLRASLFRDLAGGELVILDFGCGTGGVLKRLPAARRIGVEIGEGAAAAARGDGIEVVSALEELPDGSVDVVISFHAIEHVDMPLQILQEIGRVVKPGGSIRLVVPNEIPFLRVQRSWSPNSDRHLYTWTPLLFGNLAERAGLQEIEARLEPMPTGSWLVRGLGFSPPLSRLAHLLISLRLNSLNVILDARPNMSSHTEPS